MAISQKTAKTMYSMLILEELQKLLNSPNNWVTSFDRLPQLS